MELSPNMLAGLIVYVVSATILLIPVIAAVFSKRVNDHVGFQGWDDFLGGLLLSIFPIVNTTILLVLLISEFPNLPTPKHWGRKS